MKNEGRNYRAMLMALLIGALLVALGPGNARPIPKRDGNDVEQFRESWKVLAAITRRNLSIYPVVSNMKVDTSGYLTLDEGVAAGTVLIRERGQVEGAIYRRRGQPRWPPIHEHSPGGPGASVNELVLVNNSSRPLILLAGEVVAGGKQNRIIGADLVVPPKSDPLPLTVFCVEHGRWSSGEAFDSARAMAHPDIRREAQVNQSQSGVWDSVEKAAAGVGGGVGSSSPTQSYLDLINSPQAKRELDEVAGSIEAEYETELGRELGGRGAVGVVVAINGELVWSDVFPSPELSAKYWPKLLRSYVLEAESRRWGAKGVPSAKEAENFLEEDRGHVTIEMEPGAFRRTEVSTREYKILALEAVGKSEDSGLLLHYNKMALL